MGNLAASVRILDKQNRVGFAKNMVLNHWDSLSVKQVNFFSRYIRMFDK